MIKAKDYIMNGISKINEDIERCRMRGFIRIIDENGEEFDVCGFSMYSINRLKENFYLKYTEKDDGFSKCKKLTDDFESLVIIFKEILGGEFDCEEDIV